MIKCGKCSKENQDHYKFCLGCGSELPKDAPKQFQAEAAGVTVAPADASSGAGSSSSTSDSQLDIAATAMAEPIPPEVEAATALAPDVAPRPTPAPVAPGGVDTACPQCKHDNPDGNRFCAACGYKLSVTAAPTGNAEGAAGGSSGVILTALRADGTEAGSYELPSGPAVTVGRDTGTIFAGDSYLSPRHATFNVKEGHLSVRDEGSLNGVYVKLAPNEPFYLEDNAVFRIGQEIVRFESLTSQPPVDGVERFGSPAKDIVGRIALVVGRDTTGNAFPVPKRGLHLGRERGDVLFSEDGYVSGLHCQVAPGDDGKVYLTDIGSSNGTFVRVRENHPLAGGDILLMGQQVFRLDA